MNPLENLNQVMRYIESNLEYDIEDGEIAKRAYCSAYHFKQTFSFLAGISLQEYIRRRRLSKAAVELQNPATKIIDIAIKYGYGSPDAFARAFRKLHGVTPSEARHYTESFKAYPPMTFHLNIGGNDPMEIKIEHVSAFQVVGIKNSVTAIDEGEHPGVNHVWKSTDKETYNKIKSLNNMAPHGILHVDVKEEWHKSREYDYYMAVATTEACPANLTSFIIPEMTWAKIQVKIPWSKEKWNYIYGEWFPSSGYEQIEEIKIQVGPEVQIGVEKQIMTREVDVELWIPVRKVKSKASFLE